MPTANNNPARIVICEDDPGILEVVGIALRMRGHEVIGIDDFEALPETVRTHDPAAILLDLSFGGRSADDILGSLSSDADMKRRVILMSAKSDLPSIASKYGLDYILKPFGLDELQAALDRHV